MAHLKTLWSIAVELYGDSTPEKVAAMVERGCSLKIVNVEKIEDDDDKDAKNERKS